MVTYAWTCNLSSALYEGVFILHITCMHVLTYTCVHTAVRLHLSHPNELHSKGKLLRVSPRGCGWRRASLPAVRYARRGQHLRSSHTVREWPQLQRFHFHESSRVHCWRAQGKPYSYFCTLMISLRQVLFIYFCVVLYDNNCCMFACALRHSSLSCVIHIHNAHSWNKTWLSQQVL